MSELMEIQSHKGIYTVEFDNACIERFAEWDFDTTHFILDRKVAQLYPEQLQTVLDAPSVLLLDALETNKSLEKLPDYVEFLVDKRIRRNHKLVAIGGGIMQDITSFLAATLLRGIEWIFFQPPYCLRQIVVLAQKAPSIAVARKIFLALLLLPKKYIYQPTF